MACRLGIEVSQVHGYLAVSTCGELSIRFVRDSRYFSMSGGVGFLMWVGGGRCVGGGFLLYIFTTAFYLDNNIFITSYSSISGPISGPSASKRATCMITTAINRTDCLITIDSLSRKAMSAGKGNARIVNNAC